MFKLNKERAIFLAAVAQTLGIAQFGFFAGDALTKVTLLEGLPGSLEIVLICSTVYIVMTLVGYFLLSEKFVGKN